MVSREEVAQWLSGLGEVAFMADETTVEAAKAEGSTGGDIAFVLLAAAASLVLVETALQRYFSRGAIRRSSGRGVGDSRGLGTSGLEPTA